MLHYKTDLLIHIHTLLPDSPGVWVLLVSFCFEPGDDAHFYASLRLHRLERVFHMQLLVCQQAQLLWGTKDHPIIENNLENLFISPSPTLEDVFQQLQF